KIASSACLSTTVTGSTAPFNSTSKRVVKPRRTTSAPARAARSATSRSEVMGSHSKGSPTPNFGAASARLWVRMSYVMAAVGAALAVLAVPPVDLWPLTVVGPAVWLAGMRRLERPSDGFAVAAVYGVVFYFALMWWMSELALEAIVALGLCQALYVALFGWAI